MSERKLSELTVATTLLAGDRIPILRRALDEPNAALRNQTVGLDALAGAVSERLQDGPVVANVPAFDPLGFDTTGGGDYQPYAQDFVVQLTVGGRLRQWAANMPLDAADFSGAIPAPTGDDATDANWRESNPMGPGFLPVQAVSLQLARALRLAGSLVEGRRYDITDMVPGFVIQVYAAGPESFAPNGYSLADADNAVLEGTVDVAAGAFTPGGGGGGSFATLTGVYGDNPSLAAVLTFGAGHGVNGNICLGPTSNNIVGGDTNTILGGDSGVIDGGSNNAMLNCTGCTIPSDCERVTLINCHSFTVPAATTDTVYIEGVAYDPDLPADLADLENDVHGTGGIDERLSDLEAGGSVVLYAGTGANTDGAMTQAATTTELTAKMPKAGGTFTGLVTFAVAGYALGGTTITAARDPYAIGSNSAVVAAVTAAGHTWTKGDLIAFNTTPNQTAASPPTGGGLTGTADVAPGDTFDGLDAGTSSAYRYTYCPKNNGVLGWTRIAKP